MSRGVAENLISVFIELFGIFEGFAGLKKSSHNDHQSYDSTNIYPHYVHDHGEMKINGGYVQVWSRLGSIRLLF